MAYNDLTGAAIPVQTPSRPTVLFAAEAATLNKASQQCSLHRNEHFPLVLSTEISFSADPGNFQIDLQTADSDADANYVTKASVTQANANASHVCRIEAVNIVAKFYRLKIVSITNAVNITAKGF